MTPANERKAAERKRKREAGLVPLEVWVRAEHVAAVREAMKEYAETLPHVPRRAAYKQDA